MPPRDPARIFNDLDEAIGRQVAQWPDRASGFDDITRLTEELARAFLAEPLASPPAPLDTARADGFRTLFLGGSPKGGTTLLLQLFDHHPACIAIPHDSRTVHLLAEPPGASAPEALLPVWLRKMISPNALPPFWNLGREVGPYRALAHAYRRWDAHLAGRPGGVLLGAALAIAEVSRRPGVTHLVEKTCANVLHPGRLYDAFPDGKLVHILRDPYATIPALHRQATVRNWDWSFDARLDHVAEYLHAAETNPDRFGPDCYRLVRYERLVAEPEPVMRDLAAFAGLDFHPALTRPTVLGHPAESNSMFADRRASGALVSESRSRTLARWREQLTDAQQDQAIARVGDIAERLGYPPPHADQASAPLAANESQ